jgi:hypothetical protein
VGLTQDAAQSTGWDFALPRHNGCVDGLAESPHKLDVTAFLADFDESRCLKPALDLAEGLRPKPRQPQPLSCEPWVGAWLAAVRSEAPVLPSSWRELLLRSRLGWRDRLRGTEKRTTSLHARRSQRMVASCPHSFTGHRSFAFFLQRLDRGVRRASRLPNGRRRRWPGSCPPRSPRCGPCPGSRRCPAALPRLPGAG